jgi:hypothetical protein
MENSLRFCGEARAAVVNIINSVNFLIKQGRRNGQPHVQECLMKNPIIAA